MGMAGDYSFLGIANTGGETVEPRLNALNESRGYSDVFVGVEHN